MKRVLLMISIASVIFGGAQAIAVDSAGQPTMSKRQLVVQVVDCMRKQMAVNRVISYNDAAKVCKDRVVNHNNPVAGPLVASDALAKQ